MADGSDVNGSRRLRKKERTRAQILAAAMRLFREKGFENVTIAEISEAADVDVTTFWRHYKSKYALLYGDYDAWVADFRAKLAAVPPDVPPLQAAIGSMVQPAPSVDPEFGRLRADVLSRSPTPEVRAAVFAIEEALEREMTIGIAERMGVNPSRDPRPAVLASAVVSAGRWTREHRLKDVMRKSFAVRERELARMMSDVAELMMLPED